VRDQQCVCLGDDSVRPIACLQYRVFLAFVQVWVRLSLEES